MGLLLSDSGLGAAFIAAMALLVFPSPAAAKPRRTVPLQRDLTEAEYQSFAGPFEALVANLRQQLAAQGRPCHFFDFHAPNGGAVEVPREPLVAHVGTVTASGVVPSGMRAPLFCRWSDKDTNDLVEVVLYLDADAKTEGLGHRPEVEARANWRLVSVPVIPEATPEFAVELSASEVGRSRSDTLASAEPVAEITFHEGARWRPIATALDATQLVRTFAGVRAIRPTPVDTLHIPEGGGVADVGKEEESVLGALIDTVFHHPTLVVLSASDPNPATISEDSRRLARLGAPDVAPELFAAFDEAQRRTGPVPFPGNVVRPKKGENDSLFEKNVQQGWEQFRAKYPGAYGETWVSHVGFSRDGRQAIVYLGWQAGALEGQGTVYILNHDPNGWAIRYWIYQWFS